MTPISPGVLILLYLVGMCGAVYFGMLISSRMWRKREQARIRSAYRRGWNAGFGFLNRIDDVKTEKESSVEIIYPSQ